MTNRTPGAAARKQAASIIPATCEHGEAHPMCCAECMAGPAAKMGVATRDDKNETVTALAVSGGSWDRKD